MGLFDTHCHIQFPDYELDADEVRQAAIDEGVDKLLVVGCSLIDSRLAIDYAKRHTGVWASIGLHPHEAGVYTHDHKALQKFHELAKKPEVVAIGETGLDYYYKNSSPYAQKQMFRFQLDVALEHKLPLIFHVREAFDDFFEIVDHYPGVKGVVHSFTAGPKELTGVIERGFYVGLNGIITFNTDQRLDRAIEAVPLERVIFETDAPFLTPKPHRGKICEPKHAKFTAEFFADKRGKSLDEVAELSTKNAMELFGL